MILSVGADDAVGVEGVVVPVVGVSVVAVAAAAVVVVFMAAVVIVVASFSALSESRTF